MRKVGGKNFLHSLSVYLRHYVPQINIIQVALIIITPYMQLSFSSLNDILPEMQIILIAFKPKGPIGNNGQLKLSIIYTVILRMVLLDHVYSQVLKLLVW